MVVEICRKLLNDYLSNKNIKCVIVNEVMYMYSNKKVLSIYNIDNEYMINYFELKEEIELLPSNINKVCVDSLYNNNTNISYRENLDNSIEILMNLIKSF